MNDIAVVNTLKGLVIDAVHKAQSGHQGGAMSSMDFAYLLFTEFLRFDPDDVKWLGRDRFILSAGHESALLYSMLVMQGTLPLNELKKFRQLDSKTPGHPENFVTEGVECTTGPLGQGAAMSVGFAIAARYAAATLDKKLFNNKTWALCGDGDMQEDVTLGAASFAAHLGLGNLIWYYDRNRVQISGKIDRTTSEDHAAVFRGFGWDVIEVDGHDLLALRKAMTLGQQDRTKPLLIIGETTIAKGSFSMEGSAKTHGSPMPNEERLKTKEKLGLPPEDFYLPDSAIKHFRRNFAQRRSEASEWKQRLSELTARPAFSAAFKQRFIDTTVDTSKLPKCHWPKEKDLATRNAFGEVIEKWAEAIPHFMGGSADLEPSNMTEAFAKKVGDFNREHPEGRNLVFGVREFAMSAICNGMALYGGVIPFDATFLSFADYSRPALRLGAIQKVRVIHEFTHDSFHLGEDGPTHQPVEHLMSLRLIPDFYLMRPGDAYETQVLMEVALNLRQPSAICLSRQKLPILPHSETAAKDAARGAYIVKDHAKPEVIILATGGEVGLALKAAEKMSSVAIRVVSMPCWELFEEQETSYRENILPSDCLKRVSIEAGSTLGWQKYTGLQGLNIGLDHYGDSAPAEALEVKYGFTVAAVVEKIQRWLQ